MPVRKLLTDRYLRALPPAPSGQRVEVYDARLPGFGVRVSDTKDADPSRHGRAGKIFFILYSRFSPGAAATRRTIGVYGPDAMSLEEARRIAGEWRSLIARGVDPAVVEAERRAVEARERAARVKHAFAAVAEQFTADKLAKERNGKVAERILRGTFVTAWADRPISEITAIDVLEIVNAKQRTAPKMAGALLVLAKRFFNWVVDAQVYGLASSPCDRLKVKSVAGEMRSRDRRLNDSEIVALWRATRRMKYPVGPLFRVLLLSGLRLNEAAGLSWGEVQGDTIVIPASRMKGRANRAVEHTVPVTEALRDTLLSLPRFKGAPYLFSLKAGASPMTVTGQMKATLDKRMLRTLNAMARRRGEDYRAVELERWTNHDLRRVVRSGLSALRVPHEVAEAILAHRPAGIVGVYNLHRYESEKREALGLWAQHIASLVNTQPATVVPLRGRRR
jgi:integrase